MEQFTLNNRQYRLDEILGKALNKNKLSDFEFHTLSMIQDWFSGKEQFAFHTSGSTGEPRKIQFSRAQIIASARRTIDTFQLSPGQSILCCLNTSFVAGFMMLIRAFEGNLKLIIGEPGANPLDAIGEQEIDFIAMTPIQVKGIFDQNPEKFQLVKKLLIGGSALHADLEGKLQKLNGEVFHSYAMTETLTHVAIRNISMGHKEYRALYGVKFDQDKNKCLKVSDQVLEVEDLNTNDIVVLEDEYTFQWIGRLDNIINTGGIKINIDELEVKIAKILLEYGIKHPFCLVSQKDLRLTDSLVLMIENSNININKSTLMVWLKTKLPKYHDPKSILLVPELLKTKTGKIDRLKNADVYL